MQARFNNKVALITGGNGGLGQAIAAGMVSEGGRVVLADIDDAAGERLVREIGPQASFQRLDVSDEGEWRHSIEAVVGRYGALHTLVNAAGIAPAAPFDSEDYEQWRRCHAVNADGTFLGCKHAAPVIDRSSGGSIVNFSSIAGKRIRSEVASYGVAKAAVRALTRHVALRCAEAGLKVRCNVIMPGPIRTAMMDTMINGLIRQGMFATLEEGLAFMASNPPMKRIGAPTDIAAAVMFLASDEAGFITGAELAVDGGMAAA